MSIIRTVASLLVAAAVFWLVTVIVSPVNVESPSKDGVTADAVSGWPPTR